MLINKYVHNNLYDPLGSGFFEIPEIWIFYSRDEYWGFFFEESLRFRGGFGMGFFEIPILGMGIFHFGLDQKVPGDREFLKIWGFLLNPVDWGFFYRRDFLGIGIFRRWDFFSWDGISHQKATSA